MAIDLAAVDDNVQARLSAQVSALASVGSLDEVEDLLKRGEKVPSAWVLINGARYQRSQGASRYQEGELTLTVYLKARNARGKGQARKGEDGAYALAASTVAALLGYAPSPCGPLELIDIAALSVTNTTAIFAVRFVAATSEEY